MCSCVEKALKHLSSAAQELVMLGKGCPHVHCPVYSSQPAHASTEHREKMMAQQQLEQAQGRPQQQQRPQSQSGRKESQGKVK